jgi:GH24 family phage-related lysozyme (muramidase)
MSCTVPVGDYVAHFDPQLDHHRAWLLAVLERLEVHEPQALEVGGSMRELWSAPPAEPLAVAAVAAAASVTDRFNAVALVLPMVQEFEGCELSAYPDPKTGAEPWTIGWGSTSYADGTPVQAGDTIGQEQADALLASRLERDGAWLAQRIPGWAALSYHQQASLLSFTYNCGPNWFGSNGFATLSRCLQQEELDQVPAALLLFVNSGGTSEAGRRRRRKAEAALWCTSPTPAKPQSPGGGGSPSAQGTTGRRHPNPLVGVPRFQQCDSAQIAQRDRTCFSTSCAMLLEALKRVTVPGANGDGQ